MWSQTSIPGRPLVLLADMSRNKAGWEADFCSHLVERLQRRRVGLASGAPVRVEAPDSLSDHGQALAEANCLIVIAHAASDGPPASTDLYACWRWLAGHVDGPMLFLGCSWQHYDPKVSSEILSNSAAFAPLAVVPRSPVSARETGLFLMKFLTELELHSESSGTITGKMTWFAWSKARELLKRRGMEGDFGARC